MSPEMPVSEKISPVVEPQRLVMSKFNLRIAELVKELKPTEVVEVLSGAGSFIRASNQNQNQNGSRRLGSD